MNCPRCETAMTAMKNHNISVDVCDKGCGGIYFDWLELKKMDEKHESDGQFLESLAKGSYKKANLNQSVECPHCDSVIMMRRFWSKERSVELDECAKCGGVWLDAGELTHIYSLYKTEADRTKAASEYLDQMFGSDFGKLKDEQDNQTNRKVAAVLKFVSPSYYLKKRS